MIWEYRTLFFEVSADAPPSDHLLIESSMAAQLNQLGQAGWELVNVAPWQGGLLAFLKKNSPGQPAAVQDGKLRSGLRPSLRNHATRLAPAPVVDSLLDRSLQPRAAEPENDSLGEIRIS